MKALSRYCTFLTKDRNMSIFSNKCSIAKHDYRQLLPLTTGRKPPTVPVRDPWAGFFFFGIYIYICFHIYIDRQTEKERSGYGTDGHICVEECYMTRWNYNIIKNKSIALRRLFIPGKDANILPELGWTYQSHWEGPRHSRLHLWFQRWWSRTGQVELNLGQHTVRCPACFLQPPLRVHKDC